MSLDSVKVYLFGTEPNINIKQRKTISKSNYGYLT